VVSFFLEPSFHLRAQNSSEKREKKKNPSREKKRDKIETSISLNGNSRKKKREGVDQLHTLCLSL